MINRVLASMAAIALTVATMSSCEKDDTPTIEFERVLYTVYQKGDIDVKIVASEPDEKDMTIPLSFVGTAEKDVDYLASSETVTIKAGETYGSVTITNISLSEDRLVSLRCAAPGKYQLGVRTVSVIVPDEQEALVYSFEMDTFDGLESCIANINVQGAITGTSFKATEDIRIPLTISGDGATKLIFVDNDGTSSEASAAYAVIRAGSSTGQAKFKIEDGFSGDLEAEIRVSENESARFIAGDRNKMKVHVKGIQTPDKLVGTWKFNKIFGLDELNYMFVELEDDIDALPTHNDGFTLTFAKEADGSISLTPGGTGDFLNFFRKAEITLCEPVNTTSKAISLGKHTTLESQSFISADQENGCQNQIDTYYKLSSANRAFSATKEILGEAVVVFRLSDSGLTLEFRDYDEPPFGEMWADGWTKFDPDMFGFASLFTKE